MVFLQKNPSHLTTQVLCLMLEPLYPPAQRLVSSRAGWAPRGWGWWLSARLTWLPAALGNSCPRALLLDEEGTSLCSSTQEPGSVFLEVSSALIHWAWNQRTAEGHGVISVLFWCHGNRYSFTQHTLEVLEHL